MVTTTAPVGASASTTPAPRRRSLAPGEGWVVLLLHAVIVAAAAWTVQYTPLAPSRFDLIALALGGLLIGFVLAKVRYPDIGAHLLAVIVGYLISAWFALAALIGPVTYGAVPGRLRLLGERSSDWGRVLISGQPIADEALFRTILGLTVWLAAYTSAWTLYRRGWLATALLLPGIIAFVNLGYAGDADAMPLLILIVASCILAARYNGFRREIAWDRSGLAHPTALPSRFLAAGVGLALIAALAGWTLPISARDSLSAAWQQLEEPWSQVQQKWDEALVRFAGQTDLGGGSYASFGDQFRLGGALNLSDEPVMVFRPEGAANEPSYLAGHRYDDYNGHGWATDVDQTFNDTNDSGERFSAQMTFPSERGVYLSPEVLDSRSETRGSVEVIRPKGDLLFTRDTYLTADLQTNVQLSWRQFDQEPFSLTGGDLSAIPLDLRQFASTLIQGAYDPNITDSPLPTNSELGASIQQQVRSLGQRFLQVSWTSDANGQADTLIVTGQAPVYDDVEAVFAAQRLTEGERYSVTGLASSASPDQLRAAGQEYPDWVQNRYLQLPETVTQRTRDLAARLAVGETSPFDIALATQNFVRDRITYREDISPPPPEQDVVDYVLFDSQEGYCEYYASAMAVMLRTQGIPARVAAGYFAVPWDQEESGYLYREKNAHLWVEVFFPGYGWIAFEPTASQQPFEYGQNPPPAVASPTPEPETVSTPEPIASPAAAAVEPTPPPAEPSFAPPVLPTPATALAWAGVIAGVVLTAGLLIAALVWNWRLRGLSPLGGLFARAQRAGRWWGIGADPALTPLEYADRLATRAPATARPARVLADLYSEEIYGHHAPAPGELRTARDAWGQLRRTLPAAWSPRKRSGRSTE